jgi:predicted alpha/beta superfamily hydrolase
MGLVMKNFILFLTVLLCCILVLSISFGCSDSNPSNSNPDPTPLNQHIPGQFYSEVIDDTYVTMLSLPDNYNSSNPQGYHVIYLHDADMWFDDAVDIISELTGNNTIPQVILIGIRTPSESVRLRDFYYPHRISVPESGGGENYYEFLKTELIPFVDSAFNTQGQNGRTLVGWSAAGYFTLWNLFKYRPPTEPLMFKNYLSINPGWLDFASFNLLIMENQMSQVINNNLPVNLYATIGGLEAAESLNNFNTIDSMLDSKTYLNFNYHGIVLNGTNHFTVVPPSIDDGLTWLFNQ